MTDRGAGCWWGTNQFGNSVVLIWQFCGFIRQLGGLNLAIRWFFDLVFWWF
jgi:hypothetical protein